MTAADPWNALQRPLAFAARDNFRQLEAVADLGRTLRSAVSALQTKRSGALADELGAYLSELQSFESADRASRVRLVAMGLRLCAQARSGEARQGSGPSVRGEKQGGGSSASDPAPGLHSPLTVLRGVGPATADRLAERGLQTVLDLLMFLPLEYLDRRDMRELGSVGPELDGQVVTTCGSVVSLMRGRPRRGGRLLELGLAEEAGRPPKLWCIWFRAHGGMAERFAKGTSVWVSGTLRRYKERLQLVHPDIALLDGEPGSPAGSRARRAPPRRSREWSRSERSEERAERGREGERGVAGPAGSRAGGGGPSGARNERSEEGRGSEAWQALRCRYPDVEGVAPRVVEQLCRQACRRFADEVEDAVPAWLATELGLLVQPDALRALHLCAPGPEPDAATMAQLQRGEHEAHRRLVFDELFSLELAVALRRSSWERHRAWPCRVSTHEATRLRACLPFALTAAQERVVKEILASMNQERPMHRLLQGDVGSGKTAVAFAAAHAAMASGLQAAVMAPTEILARQHFEVMVPWCRTLGRRAALLTGETPRAARASLLALADAGEVQLLVGTHALLARELSLPNLGLAVVDEQHRFGVIQRARLRDQGVEQPLPHLLVMTATPIPRTMALTLYGDLDLSVLDEKPPGRRPPRTRLFLGDEREQAYRIVEEQLNGGRQAFVVCPLVEESDKLGPVADAVGTAEQLRLRFPAQRIGLVHGRLPPLERDRTMAAFRARELDLLVATTVIEVGIDVPSASVMVVERAERFGLAQLHQLRGRVGRGQVEGECLLLSGVAPDTVAGQRLAALVRTDDGFEIAEADLHLRGPGELFGTRQSGIPRLRFADLRRHMALLAEAKRAAARVTELDPELVLPEHQAAAEAMRRRWERLPLVGAEAG